MSISKLDLITAARSIAQDNGADNSVGAKLLLSEGDYDGVVEQALAVFSTDRPNEYMYDYTVATAGFRFPLSGGSAVIPSGVGAWVEGGSQVREVFYPWQDDVQNAQPIDANAWRVVQTPGRISALELLNIRAAVGEVIRIGYLVPHQLHATTAASSTPLPNDVGPLKLLTASFLLTFAANKLMQNTGNTGIPSDVVDRRSQADVCRSLAKDLMTRYMFLVGKGQTDSIGAASGFLDLDVEPISGLGSLWHPSSRR